MGGRVGLKGTDGVARKATKLGAKPIASERATEFLRKLKSLELRNTIELLTCPTVMGENEAKTSGFETTTLSMQLKTETTAEDTKNAVKLMTQANVKLIIFVGGDGTARDIFDALHKSGKLGNILVLGVPSGVKMYSGIFAVDPAEAAEVVKAFAEGTTEVMDFEIMDADESAIRRDQFSVKLHGLLKGPFVPLRLQGTKQVSPETLDEHENQMAVAKFIVEDMEKTGTYILGPGTTVKCVTDLLGVEKTVLGVDIYQNGIIIKDVNERKITESIKDFKNVWIVLSPIGRQGMLFGRGNQQISPEIIRKVGKERIIVGATKSKIQGIEGGFLRVDTGNEEVDKMFRGYIRVATDYREWRLMRVK
jgi:predicted polyphosphate/ATP-dependent NAD kinase